MNIEFMKKRIKSPFKTSQKSLKKSKINTNRTWALEIITLPYKAFNFLFREKVNQTQTTPPPPSFEIASKDKSSTLGLMSTTTLK